MKRQFDLTEYNKLVAEGKTPRIVTRNGMNVRICCRDRKGSTACMLALVEEKEGLEIIRTYYPDGIYNREQSCVLDLFFATEQNEYVVKKEGDLETITITKSALEDLRDHYNEVAEGKSNFTYQRYFYFGKADVLTELLKHFEEE